MRRLQDSGGVIHILDDAGAVFSCPSVEFIGFEPTYQAVPSGNVRTWTPNVQCVSDGAYQRGDPFYLSDLFALYVAKIPVYQAAYDAAHPPVVTPIEPDLPAIYADITLAGAQTATGFFCVDNGGLTALTVTAKLRASTDTTSAANILPIGTDASPVIWNIMLREARTINHDVISEGAADPVYTILPVPFVAGACQFEYRCRGGKATMCYVRERDFGRVPWPDGTIFQVKLLSPVQFVIYEAI